MTYFLGLTGGIASGKSTADDFFKKKNIPIIDSDLIAHKIMEVGQAGYQAVVDYFGSKILTDNQTINRRKLGEIVFNDQAKLKKLNSLTHPLVHQEIKRQMEQYRLNQEKLVVIDVPLLFESGFESLCDGVLVISISPELQLKRLMKRNNFTEKEALSRINNQMPLSEKEKRATYVVANTGTINDLEKRLSDLLQKIGR
ncbi:dephospho-CoA kinase [Lactobacillus taiwanensis DSM 21401]|uniref:Dephospho-CoA kinase n=1 Tax=Lactobacillus taiwanensis TaxID=508451 RepID=A0A256LH62_9LACO|nr:dephospho-CoA kinase [Lactobacillus taiwanensis]KRM98665.1 dephospho-CoA kinase [Lactobacillus taiwanensis DSM 21401]MCR1917251.1 dephospho-CoA kinase [Lactobacillus taiwanensis]OYR88258.1 dephospho-CoA kinase [Lactobacillus taiwanensis]OYR92386.1 dephospho-CoA kinase [Lactobacillus taiwanensis]OYR93697.1 dephospho-CoA kinase [Lactobacillus taiwanensis]